MSQKGIGVLPDLPGEGTSKAGSVLVPEIKSEIKATTGPKFYARDQFPPAKRAELEKYAHDLLASPGFNVKFFIELIQNFDIDQVPGLDSMLDNVRVHEAGELGKHVQGVTKNMRRMHKNMPEIDLRIAEKIRQGKLEGRRLLNYIRNFADEIKSAIDTFDTLLGQVEENVTYLNSKYELMMESVIRSDHLAEEADDRTEKLLTLCAVLEYLQDEMNTRLADIKELLESTEAEDQKKALEAEQQDIVDMSPLIIKRLGSVKPMVYVSDLNTKRFIGQRNSFAVLTITLGDLIELSIPQWKTDIVIELAALQSDAATMVLNEALNIFDDQANRASDSYQRQIESTAEMMSRFVIKAETIMRTQQAIVDAGEAWVAGIRKAQETGDETARQIEKGRNEVAEAQEKLRDDLIEIMKSAEEKNNLI